MVWSDESTFTVTGSRGSFVYRKPKSDPLLPQYTKKSVKFPASLMVWGSFSYFGVGKLVFLEKNMTMNKDRYLELLCDHLPDCFDLCQGHVFMQDGAPCHTAAVVKDWLKFCCVDFIEDWPGNSPDLNPIENIWALMKRELRGKDTSSIPKLRAAIQEVWDGLNATWLQNMADSVPKRLQSVLKRKGLPCKY